MTTERKLVTVRTISSIQPIPNADAIECATVDGWDVVVKKEEFETGDKALYFEIDSFLPASDVRFEFLMKNKRTWNEKEGARLRTVKLRGQISQGLLLPLALFPEIQSESERDLAEVLGIEKYEAPIPASLAGKIKGMFPSFIQKTDQERIQNLPEVLTQHAKEQFEVSVKLDAASMTVFFNEGEVGVCSRNLELLDDPTNTLWRVATRNRLPESLQKSGKNIAIQGELIGPGIQGNPEKLKDQQFYVFDVFNIDTGKYLGREERVAEIETLASYGATIKHVPSLGVFLLEQFDGDIHNLLAFANGPSLNPSVNREGLVFKRTDGKISFKVISNEYLLKNDG